MARHKTFNRDEALDKAIHLFWRKGYEAASMQDLVEAMGINRQSLYDTFGDKRALFIAALDRYMERQGAQLLALFEQESSAKAGLRRVFDAVVEAVIAEDRRGCLIVNTAVEIPIHDAETVRSVITKMALSETFLLEATRRAQAAGEISGRHDARKLARFLTNNMQGLRVMAKTTDDPEAMRDVVDVVFAALE